MTSKGFPSCRSGPRPANSIHPFQNIVNTFYGIFGVLRYFFFGTEKSLIPKVRIFRWIKPARALTASFGLNSFKPDSFTLISCLLLGRVDIYTVANSGNHRANPIELRRLCENASNCIRVGSITEGENFRFHITTYTVFLHLRDINRVNQISPMAGQDAPPTDKRNDLSETPYALFYNQNGISTHHALYYSLKEPCRGS